MKLRVLAIAIAAASVSFSAQAADIKFGGDFHIGYKSNVVKNIQDEGSELWITVEQKRDGLTFFGHAEMEYDGGIFGDDAGDNDQDKTDNHDIELDEVQVGVKGDFGKIIVGSIENACDKLEHGGDWNEFLAASDSRGDCGGDHEGTILYTKKMGKAEFGVSHNVDTDEKSVAVRYKVNKKLKVALGHVNKKDADNITSASFTADIGKFGLKARVNNGDIGDHKDDGSRSPDHGAHYSVLGAYNLTKNDLFNVGVDSDDTVSVGYRRTLAKKTYLFIEAARFDGADGGESSTEHAIGVQYKF
jgi:hypothetical protein